MSNNKRNRPSGRPNSNRQQQRNELNDEAFDEYNKLQSLKNKKHILNKAEFDKCGIELTPKQAELVKTIKQNTLTIVQGPAGSAKTFVACYTALQMLANKEVDKIIITKPIVDAGESIGFLPGTQDEKTQPYMKSYISTFEKILGRFLTEALIHNGFIEVNLLAYMRGDTFDNCAMILDEAQNTIMSQLMLWVTRCGKNTTAIVCGDVSQYDIKRKDAKILDFIDLCEGMKGVASFKFEREDIVRNPFLIELTDRYEKWKYSEEKIEEEKKKKYHRN